LYIPVISRWGLDSLLETSGMSEYFERELKYKCVVMDEHGAPVHPDTRKRTVRICSRYNRITSYNSTIKYKYTVQCIKCDMVRWMSAGKRNSFWTWCSFLFSHLQFVTFILRRLFVDPPIDAIVRMDLK